ncbi:MAG: hypothetical protein U5J63_10340 [Fodinibius sp.]|nr:hypothetical protein [Fodinibius sp.]
MIPMKLIIQATDTMQEFLAAFGDKLSILLPNLMAALLWYYRWGIAKGCSIAIKKLLQSLNFDSLGNKFIDQTSLNISRESIKPSQWAGTITFWIILLLFLYQLPTPLAGQPLLDLLLSLRPICPGF